MMKQAKESFILFLSSDDERKRLELGEGDLVRWVDEVFECFYTRQDGSEEAIPDAGLFAVVARFLPTPRVVVVVILDDEVDVEPLHGQ